MPSGNSDNEIIVHPPECPTPRRQVISVGDGEFAQGKHFDVAVSGNGVQNSETPPLRRAESKVLWFGAAIAGDKADASCSHNGVALAGCSSTANTGDGGVARSFNDGFSLGYVNSVAFTHNRGWALTFDKGVSIARSGFAETFRQGVATTNSDDGDGIASAGPGGIALAMVNRNIVCVGPGGVLAGFWQDQDGMPRTAFCPVGCDGIHKPDTFYRFVDGQFIPLTDAETKAAKHKINECTAPWKKSPQYAEFEARVRKERG